MKRKSLLFSLLLLLFACAPLSASEKLRLELAPEALEKLSSVESGLYLEWGVYRNT